MKVLSFLVAILILVMAFFGSAVLVGLWVGLVIDVIGRMP